MRTTAFGPSALLFACLCASCGISSRDAGGDAGEGPDTGSGGVAAGGNGGLGGSAGIGAMGGTTASLECVATPVRWERPRVAIALVISTGRSMSELLEGDGRTRWEATRQSLDTFISLLDPKTYEVGLVLFSGGGSSCGAALSVPLAPLDDGNGVRLVLSTSGPSGDASLEGGLLGGIDLLASVEASREKFVLLATDVPATLSPDCGLDPASHPGFLDALELARQSSVYVVPIGLPGTHQADDDLAQAGKLAEGSACPEPCFTSFADQPDFGEDLVELVAPRRVVDATCEFPLPPLPSGRPPDPTLSTVELTVDAGEPQAVPRRDECGVEQGWELLGDEGVSLCPSTCERVVASQRAVLTLMACAEVP